VERQTSLKSIKQEKMNVQRTTGQRVRADELIQEGGGEPEKKTKIREIQRQAFDGAI